LKSSGNTDLHITSMNSGMKDMLNVMSKFLAMGMPLEAVILRSTWNPAREIQHEELGHLSVGAIADLAVLRLERGSFGFLDSNGARLRSIEQKFKLFGKDEFSFLVAGNFDELKDEADAFRQTLYAVLFLLGTGLVVAILAQTRYGLRPLRRLQRW
jgi:predicted amidohydrolase